MEKPLREGNLCPCWQSSNFVRLKCVAFPAEKKIEFNLHVITSNTIPGQMKNHLQRHFWEQNMKGFLILHISVFLVCWCMHYQIISFGLYRLRQHLINEQFLSAVVNSNDGKLLLRFAWLNTCIHSTLQQSKSEHVL